MDNLRLILMLISVDEIPRAFVAAEVVVAAAMVVVAAVAAVAVGTVVNYDGHNKWKKN